MAYSLDSFYGILCSGLTEKTKLSFISSNSSFTECKTNHLSGHSFFSSFSSHRNSACSPSPIEDQQVSNENCTYYSGSHTFINCSWDNAESINTGCAIYFLLYSPDSSASLNIKRCSFFHCHSSGTVAGGAIHVQYIHSITISASVFYDCSCGSYESFEGGAILLSYINSQTSIKDCLFLFCESPDDGGACGIYYCDSSLLYTVDSCCYIQCKGIEDGNSQGGGIMFFQNPGNQASTNCLFSKLEAYYGGAIYLNLPNYIPNSFPVKFCFFNKNSKLTTGYGNDACFYELTPNNHDAMFEHSFSTSDSYRVGYFDNNHWDRTDVD